MEIYAQVTGASIKAVLAGESENFHSLLKARHNQLWKHMDVQ